MTSSPGGQEKAPSPLTLHHVAMPWNANDSEQGNFTGYYWARTCQDAIEQCVADMRRQAPVARGDDSDLDTEDEVDDYIHNSHLAEVDSVHGSITNEALLFIKGPDDVWSEEAQADFNELERIIKKYAARHGQLSQPKANPTPQPAQG